MKDQTEENKQTMKDLLELIEGQADMYPCLRFYQLLYALNLLRKDDNGIQEDVFYRTNVDALKLALDSPLYKRGTDKLGLK